MLLPAKAQTSQAHSEMLLEDCAPLVFVPQHALFAPLHCGPDELEIRKGNAPLARRQGADTLAREMRVRRGLLKLAARLKIAQQARRLRELELRFPGLVAELALQNHHVSPGSNTESLTVLFLFKLRN
jgi:hypothetical protein